MKKIVRMLNHAFSLYQVSGDQAEIPESNQKEDCSCFLCIPVLPAGLADGFGLGSALSLSLVIFPDYRVGNSPRMMVPPRLLEETSAYLKLIKSDLIVCFILGLNKPYIQVIAGSGIFIRLLQRIIAVFAFLLPDLIYSCPERRHPLRFVRPSLSTVIL